MCGWFSAATARASRSNRASASGSEATCPGSTLIATSRPSRVSRARYTSPIPPAPSGARISYGPRWVPAARVIDLDYGDLSPLSLHDLDSFERDAKAVTTHRTRRHAEGVCSPGLKPNAPHQILKARLGAQIIPFRLHFQKNHSRVSLLKRTPQPGERFAALVQAVESARLLRRQ